MTLREIRAAHPELFHPNQDWFDGEAFMDRQLSPNVGTEPPTDLAYRGREIEGASLCEAVSLAHLYVLNPAALVFRDYLWTFDTDSEGHRVYVGGTANGHGFEIHRHLHITSRWGVPVWE